MAKLFDDIEVFYNRQRLLCLLAVRQGLDGLGMAEAPGVNRRVPKIGHCG